MTANLVTSRRLSTHTQKRVWAWFCEGAGTTVLLFVEVLLVRLVIGPGGRIGRLLPHPMARLAIIALATGLLIAMIILSPMGRRSGGHLNPAVTVTFWLTRAIPTGDACAYVASQLLGSLAGVLLGRLLLGPVVAHPAVRYAALQPAAGWSGIPVFTGEAVSLALLMAAVLSVLSRPLLARWTPAVVGVAVAALIMAGGISSGGSFNPARQFGPAMFAHEWRYLMTYLIAPVLGGVALVVVRRMTGARRPLTCALCGESRTVDPHGTLP
jgi:glycerol uptake facilitator-like aquaporin